MSEVKFGVRFLRGFGWFFLFCGVLSLVVVALSYIGEPPDWNRFDRAVKGLNWLWVAWLQFILADYEAKEETR